ncbi:hypothetical protein QFC19_001091 [Naganishia cerealis]|uniref:Uncharacterized protein n=1 Tax=Naganishia cerealis TaxID=610337 RepID=A0ACC2WJ05_9TREE|nr:hypothetical protein QFC19_001091 [Naganishia cerealis]
MPQAVEAEIDRLMLRDWAETLLNAPDVSPENLPRIASVRTTIEPKDLPALSAWLLEYPVGYTFSDDSRNDGKLGQRGAQTVASSGVHKTNLDGEPLILVKVKISGDKELGDK